MSLRSFERELDLLRRLPLSLRLPLLLLLRRRRRRLRCPDEEDDDVSDDDVS